MAEAEPARAAPPRRSLSRHAADVALEGAALAFLIAVTAGLVAVRSREAAAEQFAQSWLRQHGVEGEVQVSRIDATGFSGRLRLGPADDPDLIADRIDVDYALIPPWAGPGFSLTPRSIRLIHPQAKLSFDGRQLHYGSLDPFIRELLSRPKTNGPAPDIRIDEGAVRLSTPYGLVQVDDTQANLSEGRLQRLEAHLLPADLRSGGSRAAIIEGLIRLDGDGTQLSGPTDLTFERLASGSTHLDSGVAHLELADLRYDLQEGAVGVSTKARLTLDGATLTVAEAVLAGPKISADIPYLQATLGPSSNGRFDATAQLTAGRMSGAAAAGRLSADLAARGGTFSTASGAVRIRTPVRIRAVAQTMPIKFGDASVNLSAARADLTGRLDTGADAVLTGVAALAADGVLTRREAERLAQNTPVLGQEPNYRTALAEALQRFSLSAPASDVSLGARSEVSPRQPLVFRSASGAQAVLTPAGLQIGDRTAGDLALKVDGGGLPPLALAATAIGWRASELTFHAALETKLDFGPAKDAEIALTGAAAYGPAGFVFTADRCEAVSAAYLDFGDNRVERPSGEICPTPGAPLISVRSGGWRVSGRLTRAKAAIASLMVRTEDAAADFSVFGSGGPPGAQIELTEAPVIDTAEQRRFETLHAKGPLQLDHDLWRGVLDLATATDRPIGKVQLVHDQASGQGSAEIDATHLTFARGALQPADLTPAAALLADAQGAAAFTGHMDWTKDKPAAGTGRLVVAALDFSSPVGPVSGAKADIALTSLAPLINAKDQTVTAELIDAFAPMKNARATFDLTEDGVHLASAQAEVAGGLARLEPMTIPFAKAATVSGAIDLAGVNLNQLVALTSYADKIRTDLVLDGKLPFTADDQHFRLSNGHLATVKPGRISIAREVLTGVESGQATAQVQGAAKAPVAEAPATNAVQTLTYDVLENLAVDSLSATVDSQPNGRLGALFSIKGRFDPPIAPKASLPLADLILGRPLEKIPLPKGTPVNLTLDTSLNFDELIRAVQQSFRTFKDLHQPSRSGPVQR